MLEIKRILCPIDFSDFSKRALDHASVFARLYSARITALHVFALAPGLVPFAAPEIAQPFTLSAADREQLLQSVKTFVNEELGPAAPVDVVLAEGGSVHAEIVAQAEMLHADLMVIGTHGRSGFEHFVLGSVTEKLLRKTEVPVLTIPRRMPDAVPAGSTLYRRILCAVDFSECSIAALLFAKSLATKSKALLTIVNVLELPPAISDPFGPGPFAYEDLQRELEADAERRFKEIVPEATSASSGPETVIAAGKPSQEILRIARERESALIVVGVHGRSAVDRMLFGSTAHHLVRQSACPVLTLCSRSAPARVA